MWPYALALIVEMVVTNLLFEFWQKPFPILVAQFLVLHQFPFDHQRFDVVNWVNIPHTIVHNFPVKLTKRFNTNWQHFKLIATFFRELQFSIVAKIYLQT
jgi:hypothetical protein